MKLARRGDESISIAFLDVITCGIGAIILLMMIARPPPPAQAAASAEITALEQQLAARRTERDQRAADFATRAERLTAATTEADRVARELAAATSATRDAAQAGGSAAAELGRLKTAQQTLSEEVRRLLAARHRPSTLLVGGVPADSEYVVFIVDTSGSMFDYAWPKVMHEIIDTLAVYPRLKALQVMNDQGSYMFPESRGQWLADSPALRNEIVARLGTWNPYSASSPAQGIYTAIRDFYSPDRKIGLYVYGDEFTGRSIAKVIDYVDSINPRGADGRPQVRIHAIGFPTQLGNATSHQSTGIKFAALMRQLTRRNGGTFVGLNTYH